MKKSKIVIGSSNLHRHFGKTEKERGFSILKCTNLEIFRVRLASLEEEDECVVISVVENMICDEVLKLDHDHTEQEALDVAVTTAIEEAIGKFITALDKSAQRLRKTKLLVCSRHPAAPACTWG